MEYRAGEGRLYLLVIWVLSQPSLQCCGYTPVSASWGVTFECVRKKATRVRMCLENLPQKVRRCLDHNFYRFLQRKEDCGREEQTEAPQDLLAGR